AALVTLAALVAFAAGSAWFAWQQHQEAARANALAAFSQQILASVDPAEARGMDTTLLQKILDAALNRVDSELAGQPRSQVAMLNAVGYAALQIGEIEQARAAFQHGVEIGVASLPADDVLTLDAQANLSAALIHLQKFSEGDALLRDVIEARTRVFGSEHAETLNAISSLAFSFDRQGRWPEARELLEKLLEIRMRRLGREHDDTLMTLNNLANALDSMGETERALGMFRQVLDVQARTIGEDHPKTLATMNNLAGASSTLGRTAEAAALYERALGIKRRVLGQNHPSLITTLVNLGVFYIEAKNFEKADAMLTEADASAKDAGAAAIVQRLGALNALARLRRMQGRKEEAIPFATSCLEIATEVFGEAHPSVVTIAANLASAELEVGRCEDALGHARRARSIAERLEPPPAAGIASADWIIGRIHAARGEAGEARAIFQQLLQIPEVLRTIRASMPADVEGALKAIEDGQASDSPCADR
ncbi:MAG TPA: tetratricopeptide repeat protein, partial [Phycisphaerales bacterium]|nr:tetratricopeptide repeat protein [Phycisphaerales bacterium]